MTARSYRLSYRATSRRKELCCNEKKQRGTLVETGPDRAPVAQTDSMHRRCRATACWQTFIPAIFVFCAAAASPPPTPRDGVVTVMHGVTVRDPYRWLEDARSPKVEAWIEAQNAYADQPRRTDWRWADSADQ